MPIHPGNSIKERLRTWALRIPLAYRLWVQRNFGGRWRPRREPVVDSLCGVLRRRDEVEAAIREVREIGLPAFGHPSKFWDALAAVRAILSTIPRSEEILDAGAEFYSPVLPWLFQYGYRKLRGCNLTFRSPERKGSIIYEPGDITSLAYPDERFGAVTCMSVVEHGVDLERFFSEMARVIRAGGTLVVSTDYWDTPIDTKGLQEFGAPVRVFTRDGIRSVLDLAAKAGFRLMAPLCMDCGDAVIRWNDLDYTFIVMAFHKEAAVHVQRAPSIP